MRTLGRWKGEKGQALVELALVLPVILLLVIGMLEFARAWNLHQVMTDAAREGARRAVLADKLAADGQTQDSVKKAMWDRLEQFGYRAQYATMSIDPIADWKESGKSITVTLSLPYRFWVVPFGSILMKTSFTMRNE